MNLLFETISINASLMGLEVNFQLLFSLDGNLFLLLVFHSQPRVRGSFFFFCLLFFRDLGDFFLFLSFCLRESE